MVNEKNKHGVEDRAHDLIMWIYLLLEQAQLMARLMTPHYKYYPCFPLLFHLLIKQVRNAQPKVKVPQFQVPASRHLNPTFFELADFFLCSIYWSFTPNCLGKLSNNSLSLSLSLSWFICDYFFFGRLEKNSCACRINSLGLWGLLWSHSP